MAGGMERAIAPCVDGKLGHSLQRGPDSNQKFLHEGCLGAAPVPASTVLTVLLSRPSRLQTAPHGTCVSAHGPASARHTRRPPAGLLQKPPHRKRSLFLGRQAGEQAPVCGHSSVPSSLGEASYLDSESRRDRQEGRDRGSWGAPRGDSGVFLTMR